MPSLESFYWFRFQGQTDLYGSKPSEFRVAIEEAFLAEHGLAERLQVDITVATGSHACTEPFPSGLDGAADLYQGQEYWYTQCKVTHLQFGIFCCSPVIPSSNWRDLHTWEPLVMVGLIDHGGM